MGESPRETLGRCWRLRGELQRLREEQRQLKQEMDGLRATCYDKARVQSTGGLGEAERLALQAAEAAEEIARELGELYRAKGKARRLIRQIPPGPERLVLEERYLLLKTWEEISRDIGYSYRHTLRLHREAVAYLEEKVCH